MTWSRPGLLPFVVAGLLVGCAMSKAALPVPGTLTIPPDRVDAFAAYFTELKRRIYEKWVYPQEVDESESGKGSVVFEVRKDGSLRSVEIVTSSGVRLFDSYIQNAIRLAAPFPPFPPSVEETVLPIKLDFSYSGRGHRAVSP